MKKITLFFLSLALMVSLAACGNTEDAPSSVPTQGFQKPAHYATVLSVHLNPHVNLYLSENGTVLAVEPINADAEQIVDKIPLNTNYQSAIKSFVSASYEQGFVQADAKVYLEVKEQISDQVDTSALLDQAESAVDEAAVQQDISISVEKVHISAPTRDPQSESNTNPSQPESGNRPDDPTPDPDPPAVDPSVKVSFVKITGSKSVKVGDTLTLTATVLPDNAADKKVTWSVVSGTSCASVSSGGKLTAKKAGTVKVRATAQDGSGVYGEISVTVEAKASASEENAAFLSDFMAVHNAGKRYTITFEDNEYDISFNTETGICSIIHKERTSEYLELTRQMGYSPLSPSIRIYTTSYYQGSFRVNADQTFSFRFSQTAFGVELKGASSSVIKELRNFVWDNVYVSKWQEIWLTQEECELWDKLLDGYIVQDIRRFQNILEVSGKVNLPFELTYYYYDQEKFRSVEVTEDTVCRYDHYYAGAYRYWEFDRNGHRLAWGEEYADESYWRYEYDKQDRIVYMTSHSSDGSYGESFFVYHDGKHTKTTYDYGYDKIDGLCLKQKIVDVFRDAPADSSLSSFISSHTYDKNGTLIKYSLYNDNEQITESLYCDEWGGNRTHTLYTYDGTRLTKKVITREDSVTTEEYIYENGELVRLRTTTVFADGSVHEQENEMTVTKPTSF